MSDEADQRPDNQAASGRTPLVVAIGGSAGGISALQTFFDNLSSGHRCSF
jgi:chemotaxis response regulator CheB